MRRKEKEINEYKKIELIMNNAMICRIAMHDGTFPYIVPMNFGYKNRCLYFHSASTGKKIDCIKQNPEICFEIESDCELTGGDKACNFGMKFRSIIGWGTAEFINDHETKIQALGIIMAAYSKKTFTYDAKAIEKTTVFKVPIKKITGKESGY